MFFLQVRGRGKLKEEKREFLREYHPCLTPLPRMAREKEGKSREREEIYRALPHRGRREY